MLWRRVRIGAFTLLVLLGAALFLVRLPFLLVGGVSGSPALCLPLNGAEHFSLYYIHSVHRSPVWENFSPGPGDVLVLTSTVYDSLGVGIPFLSGEGSLVNEGGRFRLTGLHRQFSEINLMVMPGAGQALVHRGRTYSVEGYFGPGSLIRLRIERCSPGEVIWNRLRQWGGSH